MKAKIFSELPKDAMDIRSEVFVQEQGFKNEFDWLDQKCIHLVMYEDEHAIGTCRMYYSMQKESYMIGTIAVRKPWRGKGVGGKLVAEAETQITKLGRKKSMLLAQKRARRFYEKMGYIATGYEEEEEGCPHLMMQKEW